MCLLLRDTNPSNDLTTSHEFYNVRGVVYYNTYNINTIKFTNNGKHYAIKQSVLYCQ